MMLELPTPYLVFLGDTQEPLFAKTAFGLRDWARDRCIGEWSCGDTAVTTGLPRVSPKDAKDRGARSLVIGVANYGGIIQENWMPTLLEALESGLDLIGGMHSKLQDIEPLKKAAARLGRRLIDVRVPPANIPVANGRKRTGKRLLTVGTDCALGKKYSALALTRALKNRGVEADFRATGQTGILISGRGIPMDAVVSDFEAGAAEMLSPDSSPQHWDVIEGQGSLFHPSYAAVSLGLLHGSQPDVLVVCHQAGRTHILGKPDYALPSLEETIDLNLRLGSRTNPAIRCAGVSMNTSQLDAGTAEDLMAIQSRRLGLPVADPIRRGPEFERLVDACLA
jgi:D-glutamate N-acetyltransferase